MNRTALISLVILVLAIGGLVWYLSMRPSAVPPSSEAGTVDYERFIAPATPISNTDPTRVIGARVALEKELRGYGAAAVEGKKLTKYGIYLRDLTSGATIGINESADFSPASLLKLPVAMWFYKKAETEDGFLDAEVEFTGPKGTSIEQYPAPRSVEIGKIYSLQQLIELMLQESDNDATAILSGYAGGRDEINKVYEDLGINDIDDYDTYIIDVHTYSAFFQVLYRAQYLSRPFSNKLLEVMTRASFVEGLVAGVPNGTPVAHKFGERTIDAAKHLFQLHDCGIVYVERPYALCVMTQAQSYDAATDFIAEVSRKTYAAFGPAPAAEGNSNSSSTNQ